MCVDILQDIIYHQSQAYEIAYCIYKYQCCAITAYKWSITITITCNWIFQKLITITITIIASCNQFPLRTVTTTLSIYKLPLQLLLYVIVMYHIVGPHVLRSSILAFPVIPLVQMY